MEEISKTISTFAKRLKLLKSRINSFARKADPDPRKFGNYEIVEPQNVSLKGGPVPSHILRPPYVFHHGEELVPSGVEIKNHHQIDAIKHSCKLARTVLNSLRKCVRVGMTTDELDAYAHNLIISKGAYPSPLGFQCFPKSICTSVNNIVVHGIPDDRRLKNGDIITVDVTVYFNGFHGDCANTFLVGDVDEPGKKLVKGTEEIMNAGIKVCKPGEPLYAIGEAIEKAAKERNLTIIPSVTGHGIGEFFHEPPCIWHEGYSGTEDESMQPGMVFTIEPAIGQGGEEVELYEDGWTLGTCDNSRAAQFEHTILITEKGHEILTK